MKLYYTPGACSLAPHIVLREAGLPFQLQRVDLATGKTETGDAFVDISPKGQVPALVLENGSLLTEVTAVVQYIADLKPDAGLAPAPGALQHYQLLEWLSFVSSELHKTLGLLFQPDLPQATQQMVHNKIAARFRFLERHLKHQDFLLDSGFSIADSYAFAIVNWTSLFHIDLATWPSLIRYMDRIAARPAVREAMRAEGLSSLEAQAS